MKTDSNKRLLKLVAVESLIQNGFENTTEQALNTVSDLLGLYIETLCQKIIPLQDCEDPFFLSKILIEDTYDDEQYQIKEILGFLEQQIALKNQLLQQYDVEVEDSLLHFLKVLPRDTNFKSVFKNSKSLTIEEKKSVEIKDDIELDDFMASFIEKSSSEQSHRVVGSYLFDCTNIVEGMGSGEVIISKLNSKPKDQIFEYRDIYLAEQEFLIEDFKGNEKYTLIR